jgi:diaminopimelate decarboxylase
VVGPLCTPLDILADKMALSPANIGDFVVIFQSGAYGYSASPHHFLSHPPPREIFL